MWRDSRAACRACRRPPYDLRIAARPTFFVGPSATNLAAQNQQYSSRILAAAKTSFLQGDAWAYTAGIVAILIGAALVFFRFPKRDEEERLLAGYRAEDTRAVEPPARAA